jgi:hypothetical protein
MNERSDEDDRSAGAALRARWEPVERACLVRHGAAIRWKETPGSKARAQEVADHHVDIWVHGPEFSDLEKEHPAVAVAVKALRTAEADLTRIALEGTGVYGDPCPTPEWVAKHVDAYGVAVRALQAALGSVGGPVWIVSSQAVLAQACGLEPGYTRAAEVLSKQGHVLNLKRLSKNVFRYQLLNPEHQRIALELVAVRAAERKARGKKRRRT